MSEISENEIKSMTKEQNYMRGYEDGKSDVLNKIRNEVRTLVTDSDHKYYLGVNAAVFRVLQIIDKYRNEVSE